MSDPRYLFVLYVAGTSPAGRRSLDTLHVQCQRHAPNSFRIEVVDVIEDPGRAETDKIIATPTLVRGLPLPTWRMVGDLSGADDRDLEVLFNSPEGM